MILRPNLNFINIQVIRLKFPSVSKLGVSTHGLATAAISSCLASSMLLPERHWRQLPGHPLPRQPFEDIET